MQCNCYSNMGENHKDKNIIWGIDSFPLKTSALLGVSVNHFIMSIISTTNTGLNEVLSSGAGWSHRLTCFQSILLYQLTNPSNFRKLASATKHSGSIKEMVDFCKVSIAFDLVCCKFIYSASLLESPFCIAGNRNKVSTSTFHMGGDLCIWLSQAFDAFSDYRKVLRKKKVNADWKNKWKKCTSLINIF